MRYNVLCYAPDAGAFQYEGAVLLPAADIPPTQLEAALAALGIDAPRGADTVEWFEDDLLGEPSRVCRIVDGNRQPIVCLYGAVQTQATGTSR